MWKGIHRVFRRLGAPDRRWPVFIALYTVGALYASLPEDIVPFDNWIVRWVPIAMALTLSVPLIISHRKSHHQANTVTAFLLLGFITVCLVCSVVLLVNGLLDDRVDPREMLRAVAILWPTNILVFSHWYWRIDAGGPHERANRSRHVGGSFFFPQLGMSPEALSEMGQADWKPGYFDYLFLAFTTSTALSPTDTAVLRPTAKLLMMLQASISLTILALLAARAVNIIGN